MCVPSCKPRLTGRNGTSNPAEMPTAYNGDVELFFEVYGLALTDGRRFPEFLERAVKDWLTILEPWLMRFGVPAEDASALATWVTVPAFVPPEETLWSAPPPPSADSCQACSERVWFTADYLLWWVAIRMLTSSGGRPTSPRRIHRRASSTSFRATAPGMTTTCGRESHPCKGH